MTIETGKKADRIGRPRNKEINTEPDQVSYVFGGGGKRGARQTTRRWRIAIAEPCVHHIDRSGKEHQQVMAGEIEGGPSLLRGGGTENGSTG